MAITLLVFIIILGLLIFVHEFGHFWAAKKIKATVHEFAFGFRPRIYSWKRGETEYAINAIPLGGYVRLEGEDKDSGKKGSFSAKPPGQRAFVLVAGVLMNLFLGWLLLFFAYGIGSYPLTSSFDKHPGLESHNSVLVGTVNQNSPAEQAGLQTGDEILEVSGQTIPDAGKLITVFKDYAGQTVEVTYRRGSEALSTQVTPRVNPPAGEGALGITVAQSSLVKSSWLKAPYYATVETISLIKNCFTGFVNFVSKLFVQQQVDENVTGIIGVGSAVGVVRKLGIAPLMQFTALISINLAVLNILPILPLDGGHLVFVLLEAIRRKPVEEMYRRWVSLAGLALIAVIFLAVTYKDIVRLFS